VSEQASKTFAAHIVCPHCNKDIVVRGRILNRGFNKTICEAFDQSFKAMDEAFKSLNKAFRKLNRS
jgi:hypothetical protein